MHAQQEGAGIYAGGRFRQLSVGFVVGLAGIPRLFAGVAPVVRLGAGLVMSPGGLVEDRKPLEGLAGQGLITQQQKWKKELVLDDARGMESSRFKGHFTFR